MSQYKEKLLAIINEKKVFSDEPILKSFIEDNSLEEGVLPDFVLKPTTEDEIIRVLEFANRLKAPIVVSSSSDKYYGATIPKMGGIVLDFSNMDTIIEINSEDRYAWIEPGVTYEQLIPELEKNGLRISVPLGYAASASVISTYIERVPLLTGPKMLLSEGWQAILNMHLLLANGMPLDTGTANWCKNRPSFLPSGAPGGPDLSRLFSGSQGALGIVTNLIIKAKYLPKNKKILFSQFEDLKECLDSIKKILWFDKAREILIISKKNLALILSNNLNDEEINKIKSVCPNWLLVMGIEFDEDEKYEIDLKDIKDFGLNIEENFTIHGNNLQEMFLEEFKMPNNLNNFRKYKKTLHIPFYINGDRILELNTNVKSILEEFDYPLEDLVGYIMPIEQGHTYYMDYTINYELDTNSKSGLENIKKFFTRISEFILDNGGVIDRPYGMWADLIFAKNPDLFNFLKQIKDQLDPNNILNPGRMGL